MYLDISIIVKSVAWECNIVLTEKAKKKYDYLSN